MSGVRTSSWIEALLREVTSGILLSSSLSMALPGCSAAVSDLAPDIPPVQRHPWYSTTHHPAQPGGPFRNLDPPVHRPFWRSVTWIARKLVLSRHHPPTPFQPISQADLRALPSSLRVFWLGHSTVLLQLDTLVLLTDPIFSPRASPVSFAGPRRLVPLPLQPEQLPRIHVVLISHNHYDHLDKASVEFLVRHSNPLFLVPRGVGQLVRRWGSRRVVELDWWEFVQYAGVRFHCTPARHFSGRGLTDRNRTLWASWYIESPEHRIYFGGDTGYGQHFRLIRQRLGAPELVLMPIGAYKPRWFMAEVHIDPDEALRAFRELEGEHFVPIHWGTFDQADEGLQEPPQRLRAAASELGIPQTQLHILPIGGSLTLPAR